VQVAWLDHVKGGCLMRALGLVIVAMILFVSIFAVPAVILRHLAPTYQPWRKF
jgi:hypothetical protein